MGYKKDKSIEPIYVHQILSKLDPCAKDLWEHTLKDKDMPSFDELCEFLERHASALDENPQQQNKPKVNVYHTQTQQPVNKCVLGCNHSHPVFKCRKFLDGNVEQRWVMHGQSNCVGNFKCKKCNKAHNYLLHIENAQQNRREDRPQQVYHTNVRRDASPDRRDSRPNEGTNHDENNYIYRGGNPATARVNVKNNLNENVNCRVLLDNASTSNFITVSCAKKLKLKKRKAYVPINGLGQTELGCTKGSVDVTFGPYFDETKLFNMEAYIVPKISKLPMKEIGNSVVSHLPKINLADPEFQTSAEIDILVGAELYYEIVDGEKNMDSSTSPIAIKSQLGWLIGGSKTTSKRELTMCHTQTNELEKLNHSENTLKLETLMKSFWELETLPALPILSNEEKLCEVLFNKTVKRDCDGSFIVQYPFKEPRIELGSSLSIAIRQFKQVEKRFPMQIHPKLCMYHALQQ
ncbi:uncharacterized protein LOC118438758 [Folsomia candida]|uniref:uncharacterized protein LOC118438758 n=1 Tax=Folsomia candida TaxID=158441 RepID=UPI0016055B30|nr:uncharacterized protein LOC118438758 [Folsomia candida]